MYGIPRDGGAVERALSDCVTRDIEAIAPIVDEIVATAVCDAIEKLCRIEKQYGVFEGRPS